MKNNQQLSLFTDEELIQPIITQKDAFLHFMSMMDIDMLDMVLDDENTYNDCTKAVFLEKLNESFTTIKNAGNKSIFYKRGYCSSKKCNVGCAGYMFLGNKTRHYFNCIVKEENDKIIDVFKCSSFRTINRYRDNYRYVPLSIFDDDKISFDKNVKALINFQKIDNAFLEIDEIGKHPFDISSTIHWETKFRFLYEEIESKNHFIKKYFEFSSMFNNISSLNFIISDSSHITKLLNEKNTIKLDLNDFNAVDRWSKRNKVKDSIGSYYVCNKITFNKSKNTYTAKFSDSLMFKLDRKIMKPIFQYYKIITSIPIAPF